MGLQMGLKLEETGLMYVGCFRDMHEEFRKWHNINAKRMVFTTEETGAEADPEEVLR